MVVPPGYSPEQYINASVGTPYIRAYPPQESGLLSSNLASIYNAGGKSCMLGDDVLETLDK